MMTIIVDDVEIFLDEDGFLVKTDQWNPKVADSLAKMNHIVMSDLHWRVIGAIRDFYKRYDMSPSQRPFVKHIRETLGKEMGNSRCLMRLFSGSPAKMAARIAGLPKPEHCF